MIIFLDKYPLSHLSFEPDHLTDKNIYPSHSAFSIKIKDRGQLMGLNTNFTIGLQR
ncbi:hypothetical protein LguiA_003833 [Lonicera macranthoides]